MPYIKPVRRPDLDPTLQLLWDRLVESNIEPKHCDEIPKTLDSMKGDVNYCFTKILVTMLKKFGTRYHTLSNIRAIPADVYDEFTKQFMRPYEDKKKAENGEVEPLKL